MPAPLANPFVGRALEEHELDEHQRSFGPGTLVAAPAFITEAAPVRRPLVHD
jgi:hypothetical protein